MIEGTFSIEEVRKDLIEVLDKTPLEQEKKIKEIKEVIGKKITEKAIRDELKTLREERDKKQKEHDEQLYQEYNIGLSKDDLPEVELPKTGKLISDFVEEVADILKDKNKLFYRNDAKDIVIVDKIEEVGEEEKSYIGFKDMKPNMFITFIEKYVTPIIIIRTKYGESNFPKSISSELAAATLSSHILEGSLPKINRIFTFPLPVINEHKLTFPKEGYDERFKSWMPYGLPKIDTTFDMEKSKQIIEEIFKEFCFQTPQDKTNAIASLITPSLRGIYKQFNERTPLTIWLGNRERTGKDYGAGIIGLVYEGVAIEEPPISNSENKSNNEELRKKILSTFISGRKRLHFSNNKGYLDNAVFESLITNRTFSDRLLGKNESLIFDNELEISISGNLGISFTPDISNRAIFVKLFLDIEDANSRKFERPNLHQWIYENRARILSAIYGLIKNWFEKGCPPGQISFASFPEWARVCGGIMEEAGYDSPCKKDIENVIIGGDSETNDMKRLFEICYEKNPDIKIKKGDIKFIIETEDVFSYFDFNKRSDQVKFGNLLNKFVGRILSDIHLLLVDSKVRSSRQEFIFTKDLLKYNKKEIKVEKIEEVRFIDGNLGNLGNLTYLTTPNDKKYIVYREDSQDSQDYQASQGDCPKWNDLDKFTSITTNSIITKNSSITSDSEGVNEVNEVISLKTHISQFEEPKDYMDSITQKIVLEPEQESE